MLYNSFEAILSPPNSQSLFFELNRILLESVINQFPTVLLDMPEQLMRMKISSDYSLKQMQEIFNDIMNKIKFQGGPKVPHAAALYYYPEIFQKYRDEYMEALIYNVATNAQDLPETIDVYLGNIHISPMSRLWNTRSHISSKDKKSGTFGNIHMFNQNY